REIRRSDDGPVDPARRYEPLHPSKVRIGLSQNPADEIDQNPRPSPFDRGDAHADEPPDAALLHRIQFGARDVAHHGRRTAAFRDDNRDDCVLSGDRTPDVIEVSAIPLNHRSQSPNAHESIGAACERRHRMPSTLTFIEDEAAGATRRPDHDNVPIRFLWIRFGCIEHTHGYIHGLAWIWGRVRRRFRFGEY